MSLEVHIEKKLNGFTLRSDLTAGNTATAILGASGCGKSMTLRCIAGIVKPDKGRILLASGVPIIHWMVEKTLFCFMAAQNCGALLNMPATKLVSI